MVQFSQYPCNEFTIFHNSFIIRGLVLNTVPLMTQKQLKQGKVKDVAKNNYTVIVMNGLIVRNYVFL